MKASEIIARKKGIKPNEAPKNSALRKLFQREGPSDTPELQRVLTLPRRDWQTDAPRIAQLLTQYLKRSGGSQALRPVQAVALKELHDHRGFFGAMRVGSGKSLCTFLAPRVLEAKAPLLLVPAKLKNKTWREWNEYNKNWILPPLSVASYEKLSRSKNVESLYDKTPDLLILDECHKVKRSGAGVTKKIKRFIKAHPNTIVIALSGTITRHSVMDYWHILEWCLGKKRMPLPSEWGEMTSWAETLDAANTGEVGIGALVQLTGLSHPTLEDARDAYQRRLVETPAVLSTGGDQVACSLVVNQLGINLSTVEPLIQRLEETWETPCGLPLFDPASVWAHVRELSCGFYYRWRVQPPQDWLQARKMWSRACRLVLKRSRTLDTPFEVANAIDAGTLKTVMDTDTGERLDLLDALQKWRQVKDTFTPETEPVFVDDAALKLAAEWMQTHPGIVWVEHVAFGAELARRTGKPYYGQQGKDARGKSIEDERGVCIASIRANAEGRNLQHYSECLVVSCPPNGAVLEQLIGRCHRDGQESDEVTFDFVLGTEQQLKGFWKAVRQARYIQATTGASQKLLIADINVEPVDE